MEKLASYYALCVLVILSLVLGATGGAAVGLMVLNWPYWGASGMFFPSWVDLDVFIMVGSIIGLGPGVIAYQRITRNKEGAFPPGTTAVIEQDENFWRIVMVIPFAIVVWCLILIGCYEGFVGTDGQMLARLAYGIGAAVVGLFVGGMLTAAAAIVILFPLMIVAILCMGILYLGGRFTGLVGIGLSGWLTGGAFFFAFGSLIGFFCREVVSPYFTAISAEELPLTYVILEDWGLVKLSTGLFGNYVGCATLGLIGATTVGLVSIFTYEWGDPM